MSPALWMLLGFWLGGCAGFFLFACLQVARDSARDSTSTRQWSALDSAHQWSPAIGRTRVAAGTRPRAGATAGRSS